MPPRFISPVLFVSDLAASRRFYEETLQQTVQVDLGPNLDFGSFALWQRQHALQIILGQSQPEPPAPGQPFEMNFETAELEALCQRLQAAGVAWVHPLVEQPWGQRVARCLDPDGNIVELSEPMDIVVRRLLSQGLSLEQVSQKTGLPLPIVRQLAG